MTQGPAGDDVPRTEYERVVAELDAVYTSRAWRALGVARRLLEPARRGARTLRAGLRHGVASPDVPAAQAPAAWPLVSVLVPVYEDTSHLDDTLASVQAQTYPLVETIVVDDGSRPDAARRIAACARDIGARLVRLDVNGGLSAARNAGAAAASGDYLLPLDSDDTLAPWSVEEMVWALHAAPDAAFAYPSVRSTGIREAFVDAPPWDPERLLAENYLVCTALISRRAIEMAGRYDETIRGGLEDWDLWLRMAGRGWRGVPVRGEQFRYQRRPDSMLEATVADGTLQTRRAEVRERNSASVRRAIAQPAPRSTPTRALPLEDKPTGALSVLFVVPWLTLGGADRVVLDLATVLGEEGHRTAFLCTMPHTNPWRGRAADRTPHVHALPDFLPPALWPAFLDTLIERRAVDAVVVAHSRWGYEQARRIRSSFPGIRLADLLHLETPQWEDGGFPAIARDLAGDVLDVRLVANSPTVAERLVAAYGAKPDAVHVVRAGVDYAALRAPHPSRGDARAALHLPPGGTVMCWVGRFSRQKRPDVAVEVLAEARRLAPERDVHLLLVGADEVDGEWDALTRTVATRLDVSGAVHFAGPRDDITRLLPAADVLLSTAEFEGLPLVVLESLALGVPVAGTDVGGMADAVTPATGRLVPWGPAIARRLAEAALAAADVGPLPASLRDAALTPFHSDRSAAELVARLRPPA